MKVNKLRKLIAALTATAITVSAIPYSALAVEGDNSGTGDWNGVEAEGSTWDIDHQGYRLCIVKEDGTPVTNAVDILYSNGHNLPAFNETKQFLTSRTGGNRDGYYYWTDLGFSSNNTNASDTPPAALYWDNGPVGNGAAVNAWFTSNEINSQKILNAQNGGHYIFTFKSDDDKSSVNDGKSIKEIIKSKGYLLTVEPITWFKPCNSSNTIKYPYYIYGTINNICKWYYLNNELVRQNLGGATGGGFYVNVIHCLWTSMYIESNIIGLGGVTSASSLTAYNSSDIADMYTAMQSMGAGLHVYRLGKTAEVTALIWYGKEKPDGGYEWTFQKEQADAEKIVQLNRLSSKTYEGAAYIQYAIEGTHDNPTGWRLSDSPNTAPAVAFSENIPANRVKADGPESFMNGGDSGEKRYFSVSDTEEAELIMNNHSNLKSVHFVFLNKLKEAENVLYYPKGMKVVTSVLLYNDTSDHMYYYDLTESIMTDAGLEFGSCYEDSRASVTFSGSEGDNVWTQTVTGITVEKDTSQLVWLEWTTPDNLDVMTLTVTPSAGTLENNDEKVNRIIFTVYLYDPFAEKTPPDPRPDDKADGFKTSLSENFYNGSKLSGSIPPHSWTVRDSISELSLSVSSYWYYYTDGFFKVVYPGDYVGDYGDIDHIEVNLKYDVSTVFYTKDSYTVTASASAEIMPSNYCPTWYEKNGITYMASGYGIYTAVQGELHITKTTKEMSCSGEADSWSSTTSTESRVISVGEDYDGAAVSFQMAESLFPEFYYGKSTRGNYNRILKLNPSGEFNFKENKYSTLNDTVHYTPLWYPDNADYKTLTNMLYAYTPLGMIEVNGVGSNPIRILGNVYDDWHVAVVR